MVDFPKDGHIYCIKFCFCRYAFVDVYTPGTANVFWADQTTAMIPEGNYITRSSAATKLMFIAIIFVC